ncbi:MAG: bifunctional 5,10-methylenetetrahydrofolate dehydrogenase/5,10-methenyltetrahydrofolate cyclohydrolase [Acidobacteriia bacterium]|nr:bifunctional 5,10-methylenetetrahydrofolate dehydrogenase/5,10-methenyltetrahydrofolate cyclohydrolase [Terriglobia bacterium]
MESGTARRLDGKAVAAEIRREVAEGCSRLLTKCGVVPGLTVVLVGENPASQIYVRSKEKAAREAGMNSVALRLPATVSEDDLLVAVGQLDEDPNVHGILVQLPLPEAIDEHRVIEEIAASKDVDGLHPINAGRLLIGLPGFVPCTPSGIVELLRRNGIELEGKRAVVIGRSNIVGKPLALLLLRENCTVTVCHSRTRDLKAVTREADLLVAAIGDRPAMITGDHVKPGAVVVDVGIHSITGEAECRRIFGDDPDRLRAVRERGSTLAGDVHPVEAAARASWLTPVPGGVGPLTIALLLRNTLLAARLAAGESLP